MRTRLPLLALAALTLAAASPTSAAPGQAVTPTSRPAVEQHVDDERDCQQIPPERVPSPLADDGKVLPMEVRVLVDRRDLAVARKHMAVTVGVFQRIGIALRVSYDAVQLPSFRGARDVREAAFGYARARYGGQRPRGTDVVYVMTRDWAGGFADCIGGIADPTRAFALGSVDYALEGIVPAPTTDEGHIAAHELGHLLAAHHHYANCAEAQPAEALRGEPGPCTVMNPAAYSNTGSVGTLERAYFRSYAREYAKG